MIRKPSLTKENDKVLIVAYGESMNDTPWLDTSFDLYTLNSAHRLFDAGLASLWFQMHRPGSGDGHIDDKDHQIWLQSWRGCPVMMLEAYPGFPMATVYPLQDVTNDCGPGRHFYTSSLDYMVAYAIHQRYREIHLYGVDMLAHDYQPWKHSLAWYLGVAAGRGIAISISPKSGMLKHTHIYGYEDEPKEYKRIVAHIEQQAKECDKDKLKCLDDSQAAWGRAREQEGMKKAYQNVAELLKLRENGGTF